MPRVCSKHFATDRQEELPLAASVSPSIEWVEESLPHPPPKGAFVPMAPVGDVHGKVLPQGLCAGFSEPWTHPPFLLPPGL